MKSRNFLHTHSNETNASAAKGFLLSSESAPQGDVAAASAVRRFELQHNQSPRFARRRQERRKGQALLLAVLIMLLAALLSAGFLAVVSGNLNQSARVADKTRAIEASRAGIAYANAQLSGSAQGDLWRPIDVSPAPDPGNAAYNFYYSQLDKVQGWAAPLKQPLQNDTFPNATYNVPNFFEAQKIYRNLTYGKFPDPNQVAGDAPKFLVKVREVPTNPADPEYEADHVGEIKITSIGLSEDDPNVFHRSVAYKSGRQKSPWASALRSVSNWDFENNRVPQASINEVVPDAVTGTTRVTVANTAIQGKLPDAPFNIVLSHKDATPNNSLTFGGIVTTVATGATVTTVVNGVAVPATQYTVSGVVPAGFVVNATSVNTMQVAAAIGMAPRIDLLNTGTPLPFPADQDQRRGILANGSLWLQGQIRLTALQEATNKIQSSGAVFLTGAKPVPATGDVMTAGELAPSSDVNFPGTFTSASGVKTNLVNDAWNKLGATKALGLDYAGNGDRVVEPYKPVKLNSAQNLARYRALTRNAPINSANEREGLYIDNREDIEKVGATAMTQTQLNNMLLSPPTAVATVVDNYTRTGIAEAVNAPDKSLEEQHLRGWVGPEEFLPRGALVELIPTTGTTVPYLRVTLDARADNTATDVTRASGPVAEKSWRNPNGTLDTAVYTRILAWPDNGTIFAEGNIRIRGELNATAASNPAPRSLTVVSQGNIYVEGSLSVDNRVSADGVTPDPDRKKLMLLAKKNVIVNPTRAVMARTDVSTRTNGNQIVAAAGTPDIANTITIPVANGLAFSPGDYVVANGEISVNDPAFRRIRGLVLTTAANSINVTTNDTGIIRTANNVIVRSPMEARAAGTGPSAKAIYSLVNTESTLNRRMLAPLAIAARNKLVFDHVGELKKITPATAGGLSATAGLKIKAVDYAAGIPLPTAGFTAELTNKQRLAGTTEDVDASSPTVDQTIKKARIYNNFGTGQRDQFNEPPVDKTLSLFAADVSAFVGVTDNAQLNPKGYKYQATLNEDAPAIGNPSIGDLPYYALAGVGLRYAPSPPANFTNNGRKPFAVDTDPLIPPNTQPDAAPNVSAVIPLATTVQFDLDGTLRTLITSTTSGVDLPYLGFNPGPVPAAVNPNSGFTGLEDVLTVDSSFYQTRDDIIKSTADQRVLPIANPNVFSPHSIVIRRSNRFSAPATSALLPEYRVRALKLENYNLGANLVGSVTSTMRINAFVYAQEGSWFVIPGDSFRSTPAVRSTVDGAGVANGSYIDYNNSNTPDAGESISNTSPGIVADLNRNGIVDNGERYAALRLARYNYSPIEFFGAIVENQSAVIADFKLANALPTDFPVVKGAVQDWTEKWASYEDASIPANRGRREQFKFINYAYDPSFATGSFGASQLHVPVTDELLYQQ